MKFSEVEKAIQNFALHGKPFNNSHMTQKHISSQTLSISRIKQKIMLNELVGSHGKGIGYSPPNAVGSAGIPYNFNGQQQKRLVPTPTFESRNHLMQSQFENVNMGSNHPPLGLSQSVHNHGGSLPNSVTSLQNPTSNCNLNIKTNRSLPSNVNTPNMVTGVSCASGTTMGSSPLSGASSSHFLDEKPMSPFINLNFDPFSDTSKGNTAILSNVSSQAFPSTCSERSTSASTLTLNSNDRDESSTLASSSISSMNEIQQSSKEMTQISTVLSGGVFSISNPNTHSKLNDITPALTNVNPLPSAISTHLSTTRSFLINEGSLFMGSIGAPNSSSYLQDNSQSWSSIWGTGKTDLNNGMTSVWG